LGQHLADWFGLFRVPQITSTEKASANFYENLHIYLAYVLLTLIVIHVVAAIWHHFVKRDSVTVRMIDGTPAEQASR
jgi:cytochrome b561